tara:strand:- start:2177 stop:2332 length:156 start_codon:yes stop_codon:yes gene_type:complete
MKPWNEYSAAFWFYLLKFIHKERPIFESFLDGQKRLIEKETITLVAQFAFT